MVCETFLGQNLRWESCQLVVGEVYEGDVRAVLEKTSVLLKQTGKQVCDQVLGEVEVGQVDQGAEKVGVDGGDRVCSQSKGVERGERPEEVDGQALYRVVGEVEVDQVWRLGEEGGGQRGKASILDPQHFQTCQKDELLKKPFCTTCDLT